MTGHEYFQGVLYKQKMRDQDLNTLQSLRGRIESCLKQAYGSAPRFYYGGSYGKKTMIREAFDLDVVMYFPPTDRTPLRDIYNGVYRTLLRADYIARKKTVAIRLPYKGGFHIDIVPGRAQDNTYRYATLYKNGEDTWIQTSLKIHIDSVQDVREIVKLMKLWRLRHSIPIETFPLEQIVVRALHGKRKDDYAACVQSVLEFLGDNILNVRIVDPANSNNVIEVSDRSRRQIQSIAQKNLNARYWSDVIW